MNIFFGQIYLAPDAVFPFSFKFNNWLAEEVAKHVVDSDGFRGAYPGIMRLGFRISARKSLNSIDLRGPTIFRRAKDVEFTIFLPHNRIQFETAEDLRPIVEALLGGVIGALDKLFIGSTELQNHAPEIAKAFQNTPGLVQEKPA